MYIAMNRFTVFKTKEEDFRRRWKDRQSRLAELPGFVEFQLLRCDTDTSEDSILYASRKKLLSVGRNPNSSEMHLIMRASLADFMLTGQSLKVLNL